ncbi:MAG: acetyl-CoA carboxylase biotin carboxylase subunit [Candidatus Sericytochromatia bacterium]|nr:acetyl-CoA carboxylase biotin carboxylase subunit [Candidatus Sericytochromatia bacterium]
MFNKILIANRGEIAVRVIRACRTLGIQTVAIYAEDDHQSKHVRLADEAHLLPGSSLAETYLNSQAILEIARRTEAQAIHPGYGFLSENAAFADACASAGVVFIGPSGDVIRQMGSKVEARKQMTQAGVPITPGSPPLQNLEEAQQWAEQIGYPVLLKASAGGGGRGMKKVSQAAELAPAFEAACRESQSYFGDATVYLEKFVVSPRHIEVQILGDSHGNVVHLGERDCSVQRRNQKLVEEAPAPNLPDAVRQGVWAAAVQGAKALGYCGAGTFEFVVQNNRDVYFMEVNTRLQVEHPVTEMITGRDLVIEQIRIAAGLPLSFSQEEVHFNGHAVECRINIEDARQNFRPVPGRIGVLQEPQGPWVRVDGMLQPDYTLPGSYDSMVAKLICWGETRDLAIGRLQQALREFKIEGIQTLIPFYQWLLAVPDFAEGHYNTGFLAQHFDPAQLPDSTVQPTETETPVSRQQVAVEVNGKRFELGLYLPEQPVSASGNRRSGGPGNRPGASKKQRQGSANAINSPMAGTVVAVKVEAGQQLKGGDLVCIIESMKMENDITSTREGVVKSVAVKAGDKVQNASLLIEFEA